MRKRSAFWGLCLAGGVALVCAGDLEAKSPRSPEPFRYAHAQRDCAPWDGLGWNITLLKQPMPSSATGEPKAPFPLYTSSIWLHPLPLNTWVTLSGNKGNVMYCPSNQCVVQTGRVRFTRVSPTQIEGELRIMLPDETLAGKPLKERTFPFKAPVLKIQQVCG